MGDLIWVPRGDLMENLECVLRRGDGLKMSLDLVLASWMLADSFEREDRWGKYSSPEFLQVGGDNRRILFIWEAVPESFLMAFEDDEYSDDCRDKACKLLEKDYYYVHLSIEPKGVQLFCVSLQCRWALRYPGFHDYGERGCTFNFASPVGLGSDLGGLVCWYQEGRAELLRMLKNAVVCGPQEEVETG